jgi:hypothetical protein
MWRNLEHHRRLRYFLLSPSINFLMRKPVQYILRPYTKNETLRKPNSKPRRISLQKLRVLSTQNLCK